MSPHKIASKSMGICITTVVFQLIEQGTAKSVINCKATDQKVIN